MKYYAVKVGRKTGIFTNWSEAEVQIKGFPGNSYKSFTSLEEAEAFMGVEEQSTTTLQPNPIQPNGSSEYEAYVDGSFDREKQIYGSGVVIVKDGETVAKLFFAGRDERYIESYQIAGEVFAAIAAIEWAMEHQQDAITIYYDYKGIYEWAVGNWQTKKPISIEYKRRLDQLTPKIQVSFQKVKAHSGVAYNEAADQLAKQAIVQTK